MKSINLTIGVLIIFSITVFFYFFYSSQNLNDLENELKNFDKNSSSNITEISNPIFKSKGLESNSYTIKADKGIQEDGYLRLYNLKAELEGKNNKIFYVSADKGLYNQLNETIKLSGNVTILDELKNKTTTKKAVIEIEREKISLLEEVVSISANSYISSNSSVVDESNDTITYTGDVKVKIENE